MKHPILYRLTFYSCLISLVIAILFLLNLMQEAPFSSRNMRQAYYDGCNIGSKPLTDESVAKCEQVADLYKQTLDDLDKQMEQLSR